MADGDAVGLDGESADLLQHALREDVIQQHGVDASDDEIGIRMGVVLERHRLHAVLAGGAEQDLVGDRAAERPDAAAPQIGERAVALRIRGPNAQDLAELVIRNRRGERRAVGWRVFDAVEAEIRVAPADRLDDGPEGDVDEPRRASKTARQQFGDLDLEADDAIGARRIGLDIRGAAFGVARPDQLRRRLRRGRNGSCSDRGERQQHTEDVARDADASDRRRR